MSRKNMQRFCDGDARNSRFETQGATWEIAIGIDRQVTASFGCAVAEPGDRSVHDAIVRADANLYAAKIEGRNRVVSLVGAERGAGAAGKGVSFSPVRSYSR